MNQELENYIKESKNSGFTDEQIKQELKKAGWQENDINQAFDYSVPVPPVNVSKPEKKSFVYYYIEGFKKYADFNGRSRRKEYWFFVLGNLIVGIFIFGIGLIIVGGNRGSLALSIFFSAFSLLIIIPSLAVLIRRLHDTNRSGLWWFLNLIPIIGGIILLIFTFQDSNPNSNKYGPNPKLNGNSN